MPSVNELVMDIVGVGDVWHSLAGAKSMDEKIGGPYLCRSILCSSFRCTQLAFAVTFSTIGLTHVTVAVVASAGGGRACGGR